MDANPSVSTHPPQSVFVVALSDFIRNGTLSVTHLQSASERPPDKRGHTLSNDSCSRYHSPFYLLLLLLSFNVDRRVERESDSSRRGTLDHEGSLTAQIRDTQGPQAVLPQSQTANIPLHRPAPLRRKRLPSPVRSNTHTHAKPIQTLKRKKMVSWNDKSAASSGGGSE